MAAVIEAIMLTVFPALMAFAAASDLVTMTISNRVSMLLIVAFVCLAVGLGLPLVAIGWHVAMALVVLTAAFGMFAAGWIGGGDAKLAAATALWVGPAVLLEYLLVASFFGGVLTLFILTMRMRLLPAFALSWAWLFRLHHAESGIPYGIALAASGLLVYPSTPLWRAAFAG